MSTCGILLAAGAGSRMGKPKALVTDADGQSWLHHGVTTLQSAGLSPVIVVLGAQAEAAVELLPTTDVIVVISDWQHGMSASLRCGLEAAMQIEGAEAAAISWSTSRTSMPKPLLVSWARAPAHETYCEELSFTAGPAIPS
ncbi:hypothetical protein GCM10020255_029930 [Rhodococcus baikonurensis]